MDDKAITGFGTKIPTFTIAIWIYLVTFQSIALDQTMGTTTIPTASLNFVVTKVIDGDTLDVKAKDGKTIITRLAQVDDPETKKHI